jgi:hypothetical protein
MVLGPGSMLLPLRNEVLRYHASASTLALTRILQGFN